MAMVRYTNTYRGSGNPEVGIYKKKIKRKSKKTDEKVRNHNLYHTNNQGKKGSLRSCPFFFYKFPPLLYVHSLYEQISEKKTGLILLDNQLQDVMPMQAHAAGVTGVTLTSLCEGGLELGKIATIRCL